MGFSGRSMLDHKRRRCDQAFGGQDWGWVIPWVFVQAHVSRFARLFQLARSCIQD